MGHCIISFSRLITCLTLALNFKSSVFQKLFNHSKKVRDHCLMAGVHFTQFDWGWPTLCDRDAIEGWMRLDFIKDAINPILCGPNGIGKSMIACNVAHEALLQGHTVHFTTASQMLNSLERLDSDRLLRQRIKYYIHPTLLVIDGIGMLSYTSRHADLLFEVIHNRYEKKPTFITMTKSFPEWRDIFPNASSVVSIIDRLVHHSKIVTIDGPSFRLKESNANILSQRDLEKS